MPVCGIYAPALLRSGKLWILLADSEHADPEVRSQASRKERYLLGEEHLLLMGVASFAQFSGGQVFPHLNCKLTQANMRSLAGNVSCMHAGQGSGLVGQFVGLLILMSDVPLFHQ